MAKEAQYMLLEALKAHVTQLETERVHAPGPIQSVLDKRLEAARKTLEWLAITLEDGYAAEERSGRKGSSPNHTA